jgi:site-specific DNA-methyltransferase (adenine-specific)
MKYDLNQIILADCMDIMRDIPDKYFELAIVDPPYGIERFKKCKENNDPNTRDVFANKFLGNENFNNEKPDDKYFDELFRISKNQIIWGANNFTLPPTEYFCCWNKEQAMPNFATLEYAWVSLGLKKPAKLFTYSIHKHNQIGKIHPTQKPIALYRWLLQNYAKPGDKIIDTHSGSGSCAIACHIEKHDFLAIEKDPDYHAASVKRLEEARAQGVLF